VIPEILAGADGRTDRLSIYIDPFASLGVNKALIMTVVMEIVALAPV
jgi:hypothetical protein